MSAASDSPVKRPGRAIQNARAPTTRALQMKVSHLANSGSGIKLWRARGVAPRCMKSKNPREGCGDPISRGPEVEETHRRSRGRHVRPELPSPTGRYLPPKASEGAPPLTPNPAPPRPGPRRPRGCRRRVSGGGCGRRVGWRGGGMAAGLVPAGSVPYHRPRRRPLQRLPLRREEQHLSTHVHAHPGPPLVNRPMMPLALFRLPDYSDLGT